MTKMTRRFEVVPLAEVIENLDGNLGDKLLLKSDKTRVAEFHYGEASYQACLFETEGTPLTNDYS